MIQPSSLFLVIASALLHPLWNMLLKKSDDKLIFYTNIHLIFTALFFFVLFWYPLGQIHGRIWFLIFLSATTHFFYQVFLCKAYDAGDLSLTYPVIRSSSVFILILAFVFLREVPTVPAVAGIFLIIAGACLANQERVHFSLHVILKRSANKAMFFAVLTALFSALYSIVDKKAVLEMNPILFFYLFFSLSGFMFLGYILLRRDKRERFWGVLKKNYGSITLASVLEFLSYLLILYAFKSSNTAYVTALRQLSVIAGVVYGSFFLKEKFGKIRLVSSLLIFAGAFLIVVYG